LHAAGEHGPALLVEAGEQATDLVFVDGNRLFFRSLPMGRSDPARLAQEVKRSLTFYRSQQQGREPECILVNGVDGLADDLSASAAVAEASACSVCFGLSVEPTISINLIPASVRQDRELRKKQPLWLASAVVLMLLMAVWIAVLNFQQQHTLSRTVSVEKEVEALSRIEQRLLPLEHRMSALYDRVDLYESNLKKRSYWLRVLDEVGLRLPEGMFLLSSEPIRPMGGLSGTRITVVSYLDKEAEGQDVVRLLRDALRSSALFSEQTKVFSRPSKKLFAREFILDVYFEEGE
jgi:Tfp pilus assembly protein PilN